MLQQDQLFIHKPLARGSLRGVSDAQAPHSADCIQMAESLRSVSIRHEQDMSRTGRIFASLVLMGILHAQSPTPVIRVPVRLVTAPTLVFSKDGNPISGLERGAFRLFDNGELQKVTLDTASTRLSVVLAVQVNQDVRSYLPFVAKGGSVLEALLVGETGEAAVIAYGDDVSIVKPFDSGDVSGSFRKISANGREARMADAGAAALDLLKTRPAGHMRVVIFIGQPVEIGSTFRLELLRERAESENVAVYAMTLPFFGKAIVSDVLSIDGLPRERGGVRASVNLGKLIPALGRGASSQDGSDPFSVLTAATGGVQHPVRRQKEFERAIADLGIELRSASSLSYAPSSTEPGYHTIRIEVDVPGARVHSRPGYWLNTN
jgi:VWFA-related protein